LCLICKVYRFFNPEIIDSELHTFYAPYFWIFCADLDPKKAIQSLVEIKNKWEREHPGEPLLAGLIQEAKSVISKADPELRKTILMGIQRARKAITKLIQRQEEDSAREKRAPELSSAQLLNSKFYWF